MNKSKTSQTGSVGEDVAAIYLQRKGFKILARNYRKPWGEIDIIAEKDGVVRFVEVKAISVTSDISCENITYDPEEQIHPFKLKKVVRTAELYMASHNDEREFQIDAVGVFLDHEKRQAKCRLFEQIL